jgi:plastocyanin
MGFTRRTAGVAIPLAVAAVVLAGCGGDEDTGRSASGGDAGPQAVTISDYAYEPARIVVPRGTTVAFANRDAAPHTATSKQAGAFDTGTIKKGQAGEIVLEETGTFAYYCLFHPFMSGTVVVE